MKRKQKDNVEEVIDPYKIDKGFKIPSWLVILFLKYWVAAATVFFVIIGGLDIGLDFSATDTVDPFSILSQSISIVILLALFMAVLLNYVVRMVVFLLYNRRDNTYLYNMVNLRGFKSFLLCFLYTLFMSIVLFNITIFLSSKYLVLDPFGTSGGQGLEPFTYGFCFIIVDAICLLIKDIIVYAYKVQKYKKQIKED